MRSGPPGEFWHYSDVGYSLLGVLAEAVTGQSFDRILNERVLAPLGFANSTASVTTSQRSALAMGYKRQFDDRPWRSGDPVYPDLDGNLLRRGEHRDGRLGHARLRRIPASHVEWRNVPGIPGATACHGRSCAAARSGGREGVWLRSLLGTDDDSGEVIFLDHGGDMVGYESGLLVDIANGICVVMLANGAVPDYMMTNDLRKLVVASIDGDPLPELSSATLRSYDGADAWAGEWYSAGRQIEIVLADDGLTLIEGDDRIPLQRSSRRSDDSLTVGHPDWDRFLLEAVRDSAEDDDTWLDRDAPPRRRDLCAVGRATSRNASLSTRMGEVHRVLSILQSVVSGAARRTPRRKALPVR
ncbi:MAG: serine hydrolase domain-containing protein [Thermomicrobiales bacterium]